jgi:ribosome-associated translation inhibitor RaiA
MPFKMNFRDVPHSPQVQDECEGLAQGIRDEFPETSRVDVTLGQERGEYEVHVHVTGRDIDLAAHSKHRDSVAIAAREAFEHAHAQLRKHHDKLIKNPRRDARPKP